MDLSKFMTLEILTAILTVVASFVVVKTKTTDHEKEINDLKLELKNVKEVLIPTVKKEALEAFDKDIKLIRDGLEKRDLAIWGKLDAIQTSINQIMQSLGRLEGRSDQHG